MSCDLGKVICQYRQINKMTQEEFASRLGVTPQAVSKWERGNGLPDVTLIEGICRVLGISADTLLGISEKVVESGSPIDDDEIKTSLIAEPIVIEFSYTLIELMAEGINTSLVQESRQRLAREKGYLLPIIRFRDNCDLKKDQYQVLLYDKVIISGSLENNETDFYKVLITKVENYCRNNYSQVINKSIVKTMTDNLKSKYPGVADELIPEQISYYQVEKKLKELIESGESIKDLIHIIEKMEEDIG